MKLRSRAWIFWHGVPLAALLLLPSLKFDAPFWSLEPEQLVPWALLTAAFLLSAIIPRIFSLRGAPLRYAYITLSTAAVFGLVFLVLWLSAADFPRSIAVGAFLAALVFVPVPFIDAALRPTLQLLAVAAIAVLAALGYRQFGPPPALHPSTTESIIESGYYNIRAVTYADQFPRPAVPGGGIAPLAGGYLLITGDGHLYLVGWGKDSAALSVKALPARVPVNGEEFSAAAGVKYGDERLGGGYNPVSGGAVQSRWFRVGGMLVDASGGRVRVFASHHYWKSAESCFVMRVSMLDSDLPSFLDGTSRADWKTLYETSPCLPVGGPQRRRGTPFAGLFMGGRMVLRDANTLLLTVGDHGFDGVNSRQDLPQDPAASYGKTVLIHLDSGTSEIYTLGHRNPQGLVQDPDGTLWLTEQGPRGGDELNLLAPGKNYGWPYVTYGTDYYSLTWPLRAPEGIAQDFVGPVYAWQPSIAVSDLIRVSKDRFAAWKGDLVAASLAGQSLYRIRMRERQVVLVEPIRVDRRIRDLTEGPDGRIVLWTDDALLISLLPAEGTSGELLFDTRCGGCHRAIDSHVHSIGPDLYGVVGRPVGSAEGYKDYSPSLKALTGNWTAERLDQFLHNPRDVAAGTTMEFPGIEDKAERQAIIEYLRTVE